MANLSARFTELQAELIRLRQDPHDPDEADRLFRRIAVRAAMCYRKCALAKLDGFEPDFFLKLPDNPEQAEVVWVMAWECIVNLMVSRFSDELEPTPVHPFGDVTIEPVSDENRVGVSIVTSPPDRWRQRFEDHARVLGLLAQIAEAPAWRSAALDGEEDVLLTINDAAERTDVNVSDTQIRRWRDEGMPTAPPPAGKKRGERVRLSDLLAWHRGEHPKQQQATSTAAH